MFKLHYKIRNESINKYPNIKGAIYLSENNFNFITMTYYYDTLIGDLYIGNMKRIAISFSDLEVI